jgi:Uma2 family endonuclease
MHTNRMVELSHGCLEVLPMPTWIHQLIVVFFFEAIQSHLKSTNTEGTVLLAPLPVQLFSGTIREPDVLYVAPEHIPSKKNSYPQRVDLVVEVVSEGVEARRRDYEHKRDDYAQGHVSEYWIVDPEESLITVLGLVESQYEVIGTFKKGEMAIGRYLPGLSIDVRQVMELGD